MKRGPKSSDHSLQPVIISQLFVIYTRQNLQVRLPRVE